MRKGAVNVAETGPAACKSRAALTARNALTLPGYHRCHGEGRLGDCPTKPKLMLDPSVRKTNPPFGWDMLPESGWADVTRLGASGTDVLSPGPEAESSQRNQGQSQSPKASRVLLANTGTSTPAPGMRGQASRQVR